MNFHDEQPGCISSHMLSDTDLLTAIDGEAGADVFEHLLACRCCAARAELLARVQNQLRSCLVRAVCPTTLTLIDYYLRLLDPTQHSLVAAHLLTCEYCAEDLAQIVVACEPVYRLAQAS